MKQLDGIYCHYHKPTLVERYGGLVRVVWIMFTGAGFFISLGMFVGVNL